MSAPHSAAGTWSVTVTCGSDAGRRQGGALHRRSRGGVDAWYVKRLRYALMPPHQPAHPPAQRAWLAARAACRIRQSGVDGDCPRHGVEVGAALRSALAARAGPRRPARALLRLAWHAHPLLRARMHPLLARLASPPSPALAPAGAWLRKRTTRRLAPRRQRAAAEERRRRRCVAAPSHRRPPERPTPAADHCERTIESGCYGRACADVCLWLACVGVWHRRSGPRAR